MNPARDRSLSSSSALPGQVPLSVEATTKLAPVIVAFSMGQPHPPAFTVSLKAFVQAHVSRGAYLCRRAIACANLAFSLPANSASLAIIVGRHFIKKPQV
jgi:hypothetical protein